MVKDEEDSHGLQNANLKNSACANRAVLWLVFQGCLFFVLKIQGNVCRTRLHKNLHPLKSYFTRLTRGNVTVAQYKQRKLTTCQLTRAILDS